MGELIKIKEASAESAAISALSQVESRLAEMTNLDDVKVLDNQTDALQRLLEKSGASLEDQCKCAVARLWIKRKIGELLDTDVKRGPNKFLPRGKNLEATERHRCREIARIRPDVFREEIERRQAKVLADEDKIRLLTPRNLLKSLERGGRIQETDEESTETGETEEVKEIRQPVHSPIIKPSDNWNFANIAFERLDDEGFGYIPGDLYANVLWYYSRPDDLVYCPMAGSGQIIRVWEERERWMRPDVRDITLITSDLTPRGPYQAQIVPCDITTGACIDRADLIVMDLPYFGMVNGQYSDSREDIANTKDVTQWAAQIERIASVCAGIQEKGGRVVTVCPNYVDWEGGRRVLITEFVRRAFTNVGYDLFDLAYSTRRIQQTQTPTMAQTNKRAKERRLPLSDMAEVAVFELGNWQ